MDPGFVELQESFCVAHCSQFELSEENKLCYMEIFEQYQSTLESYIEKKVGEVIDGFSFKSFATMLQSRRGAFHNFQADIDFFFLILYNYISYMEIWLSVFRGDQVSSAVTFLIF